MKVVQEVTVATEHLCKITFPERPHLLSRCRELGSGSFLGSHRPYIYVSYDVNFVGSASIMCVAAGDDSVLLVVPLLE